MAADAIIVGGGSGARFGQKKQFVCLGETPLLKRAVACFETHGSVRSIVIVVPEEDIPLARELLSGTTKPLSFAKGGSTRQESVSNGLSLLKESEYVLIHDAVRPFVTGELISRVLSGMEYFDACIPGLAVTNTLKEVSGDLVVRTVPRSNVYGIQTPQCFRTERIVAAHSWARRQGIGDATDDSALIEAVGGRIRIVEGDPFNMKITVRQDMEIAEAILRCRTGSD
ncbi:MAG TPA: 2-C-methyl-D-erythritol 4-phosphate cytidylyltransferase [Deltaproteobacteria bacterium]|jgi:2-C-methyl-D-erythritol 4-phosphate cytidylyltransferase|nr:2-C-methyl-D-erythritol 4-phosphate cytidylyltransferase [Deltaproteobacteria bacterium]HQJ07492.1 2-C-methyl-D-erythritol 4-phosphate cytidylyltransferase [Deltaproteobacteria bacterium]